MPTLVAALSLLMTGSALPAPVASPADEARARVDQAARAGQPLVAHAVVALCDNAHQGVVPVRAALGNGQDPARNLYWGARFGVRQFLVRDAGWRVVAEPEPTRPEILDAVVLHRRLRREGQERDLYLVAEAWDGQHLRAAVERFLELAAGRSTARIRLGLGRVLPAGGDAHLLAFIGHNGFMDFELEHWPSARPGATPRSAVVLACASQRSFTRPLQQAGAYPLLLTTTLLAPEAYLIDAVMGAWLGGDGEDAAREAAARAYARYQRIDLRAARRLFDGAS